MHGWAARVARDWPAFEVVERDGWRLGSAEGVTKRANSALLLDPGADPAGVTAFYRERGTPPCAQVWPGEEEADARLARHGYAVVEPTLVLAREPRERPDAPGTTAVTAAPGAGWLAHGPAGVDVMARILGGTTALYGTAPGGAGRGCAVLSGRTAAVCAMVTAPAARRRGVASALLADLLARAHDEGATDAYLCVVTENTAARRLYEGFGFTEVSRYHNRVLG
ncbi:GNAT family N-acetyltransferase [Nocardiopsis flavescens]|uniref:Acetyltransferase (GNAT) family protein n=1 Tax=Nocardiopsis flavescens TaxID=758803 RepID=A0A1M6MMP1_9ACTN|nr:GNAT family N-acetyltransferase [Nocardiopsis flavescens]SHJ84650.1 Acetyltransferase (GNAT) family protein [Nocardiopsis flavescens]